MEIEFRRHSIKDGPVPAMIGPKGYALAREVGRLQLQGRRFDAFYVSTYWRTHQTLAAFAEGAGDFVLKLMPQILPLYVAWPEVKALWGACAEAEKRGEDLVAAAFANDPLLVRRASEEFSGLFEAWAAGLDPDARVLVVGHSPHLEIMAYGLTGAVMPGLKECQGFRVRSAGDVPSVEASSPDLDPAGIRAALFPSP